MRPPRRPAVGTPIPRLADHKTRAPPAHAVSSPLWLRFRDRARLDHHADLPACQHQSRAELLAKHMHPLVPTPHLARPKCASPLRTQFGVRSRPLSTAPRPLTPSTTYTRHLNHHVDLRLEREYRAWPTAKHAPPPRAPPPRPSRPHFATAPRSTTARTSRSNAKAAPGLSQSAPAQHTQFPRHSRPRFGTAPRRQMPTGMPQQSHREQLPPRPISSHNHHHGLRH
ncbi:hypothetical protein SCP_0504370 [Sparassis crispa]|uniref:Uncharacterized protein n=1 Tax=Sparassis crispa TaxID=139825 RepID=A0A401GMJ4_9APHY|nr:hypothetical protein SCP_0504370 [Sparassis crispa]GBE83389.1 hypothetical protein SCP_0504370 [Sparassis crispa]